MKNIMIFILYGYSLGVDGVLVNLLFFFVFLFHAMYTKLLRCERERIRLKNFYLINMEICLGIHQGYEQNNNKKNETV